MKKNNDHIKYLENFNITYFRYLYMRLIKIGHDRFNKHLSIHQA